MIILLMVIVLLALAWGLADLQLSAPIQRPEPPLPVVKRKVPQVAPPEVPKAEPASPAEGSELPQPESENSEPVVSPITGEAPRADQSLDK